MFVQMRFGGGREWSCDFFNILWIHFVTKLFLYVQAVRLLGTFGMCTPECYLKLYGAMTF